MGKVIVDYKYDEGINQFTDAKKCITEATALLDHNSLRFGGVNSTLEEQLDILNYYDPIKQ